MSGTDPGRAAYEVPAEEVERLIGAAQSFDYEHRRDGGERGGNWQSVPDRQVRRLLTGAGLWFALAHLADVQCERDEARQLAVEILDSFQVACEDGEFPGYGAFIRWRQRVGLPPAAVSGTEDELEPDIHCNHCTDGCVRCDPRKQDPPIVIGPELAVNGPEHHAQEAHEYCVVHDHPLDWCKEPESCREQMRGWGLYANDTAQEET